MPLLCTMLGEGAPPHNRIAGVNATAGVRRCAVGTGQPAYSSGTPCQSIS